MRNCASGACAQEGPSRNDGGRWGDLLCPQLPLVRRIIWLIDRELVHRGVEFELEAGGIGELQRAALERLIGERIGDAVLGGGEVVEGDTAQRAVGPGVVFDAIEMLSDQVRSAASDPAGPAEGSGT